MADYWERSLLSKSTFPLSKDILNLYEIEEELARSLDFRSGFQLVEAHWYSEIVRAMAPKQQTVVDTGLTVPITNNMMNEIMAELAAEHATANLTSNEIRHSLETDRKAWLEKKVQAEDLKQPYLPLERVGVNAAIMGAIKLFTEITKPTTQATLPPKQ
ncbi:hypothetical protein HY214_00390 [Candidatus Roizmanbacteria bacterium]|nr:hypothetical protein [Candidatus Roizmanbacteria bacterium]